MTTRAFTFAFVSGWVDLVLVKPVPDDAHVVRVARAIESINENWGPRTSPYFLLRAFRMMVDFSKVPAFLVIGASCYLLGLVSLYLLTSIVGIHYLVSNVLALAIVYPVGFYLNRVFNFKSRGPARTELVRYYLASFALFLISLSTIYVLVHYFGVWYMTANIIVTSAQVAFGFLVLDRWVFRR